MCPHTFIHAYHTTTTTWQLRHVRSWVGLDISAQKNQCKLYQPYCHGHVFLPRPLPWHVPGDAMHNSTVRRQDIEALVEDFSRIIMANCKTADDEEEEADDDLHGNVVAERLIRWSLFMDILASHLQSPRSSIGRQHAIGSSKNADPCPPDLDGHTHFL